MRWRVAALPIRDWRVWRGTLPLRKPGTLNSWLSFLTVSEVSLSISEGSTSTRRRTFVGLSRSTVVFIEGHRSAQFVSLDGGWGCPRRGRRRDNRVVARRSGCFRDVAQLGSAPALGAGSREFKSPRPDVPVAVAARHPARA